MSKTPKPPKIPLDELRDICGIGTSDAQKEKMLKNMDESFTRNVSFRRLFWVIYHFYSKGKERFTIRDITDSELSVNTALATYCSAWQIVDKLRRYGFLTQITANSRGKKYILNCPEDLFTDERIASLKKLEER